MERAVGNLVTVQLALVCEAVGRSVIPEAWQETPLPGKGPVLWGLLGPGVPMCKWGCYLGW